MILTSTVSPSLKIGLQFLGMWPNVAHSTVYWLSVMLSILIMQCFQYLYIFKHLKVSELLNLVDSLTVAMDYSLTMFKLICLWINRRVFHQILTAMDDDWHECINNDQHLYIMTVKANISHFCFNALLSFNAIATILYFLGDYIVRFMFLNEEYNDTLRQLPVKIQLPFDIQQSPIFEFLALTTISHVMLHASIVAILNGLIFTLVLHVSGQIDIICQELKNISENILYKSSMFSLGMLIERHNKVILFSENMEKFFSFFALMQVVWNTLVISSIGFVFIIFMHSETGIFILIKTIFAYIGIMIEAFIICFAGEYLSLKGNLIASATYEILWYDMPPNQSKIIMFVIMRSQKQLRITAGKMMDMSIETFASIIKASASYLSVLNAIY
ncbi:odorant receptor 22c-like [Pogonomyrmex barbatus]|uniref:Odorant receptor n=1 Tax=Pogonomyrmex barbatus TaxID=144034 RepID=A0A8N1S4R5_9HYME|nr:odorant receptor 22c-like [Pogonomyrmex barbatus]